MKDNQIKVEDLGSPSVDKHEVGFLPGIIETEGREILFDFRSSKLSSSRCAVTLNKRTIDCSGITSVGMCADKDNTIRGEDLLLQDTEDESLLFR